MEAEQQTSVFTVPMGFSASLFLMCQTGNWDSSLDLSLSIYVYVCLCGCKCVYIYVCMCI